MESIHAIVGQCYYVRSLTDHWVGRCVAVGAHIIVLKEAAWIADSGRLHVFMAEGKADGMEVEVLPPEVRVRVTGTVLDWPHALFTKTV